MTVGDTRMRSARSLALKVAVASVVLLGVGATAAWANWAATASVPGAELSMGELDLQFTDSTPAGAVGQGTPFAKTLALSVTNLTPGESAAFTISPRNAGTVAVSYTISAYSGSTGVLSMRFYDGPPGTQTTTYPRKDTCGGNAIGDVTQLETTGKSVLTESRTLQATAGEQLCVVIAVQASAPASAAGTQQSIAFDFTANPVPR